MALKMADGGKIKEVNKALLESLFYKDLEYREILHILRSQHHINISLRTLKDGAYYCYCAYALRILRYSDFLSVMLTNTGIFLRGLKLSGESRS